MKKKEKEQSRFRMNINLKMTLVIFSFFFLIIAVKLVYVSVSSNVDGTNLAVFANNRNTTKQTLYASRGSIFDVNGDELAKNVKSYTVIAFLSSSRTTDDKRPKHVIDKESTAAALSPIINMTKESLVKLLSQELYQVELGPGGRGITEDTKKQIEKLDLPGISFISSTKRFYKNKNYASYLIGYARKNDAGEIIGEMGIESYFDNQLKGTNGFTEFQQDAYGYPMPNTPVNTEEAESGSDIYLTIDNNVQFVLENILNKLKTEHSLDWGLFSVMDAKSGAILGSATVPTFDLNTLDGITSYLNPLTSYQFEPGSTMKIFSFMNAIEEGIYKGDEMLDSGTITLKDGTKIKDFNNSGWGSISYDTGFAYSSNVAATKLSLALGVGKMKDFYEKFGFGKKTGINLPSESDGIINFNYESELANASFGQGITVTPIQMLQALTTLVNGGVMVKPYVISKVVNAKGEITSEGKREELGRVASVTTVEKMKKLMYDVVYNSFAYNKGYAPNNVTIAGKTGTAQIASPKGGYLTGADDYIKSFAGFFPYENPQYVFYFSVKQLKSTSSELMKVVSSTIGEIAKVLNLVEVVKDTDTSKIITMNNYISKTVSFAVEDLNKYKLVPVLIGDVTYIINQYPLQNQKVLEGSKVFLMTNGSTFKMPETKGWSANEIIRYCNFIGLSYHLTGYGNVASTSVPTNTVIDLNVTLEITLTK